MKYIRVGKCLRCGKCCTMEHLFKSMPRKDKEALRKNNPILYRLFALAAKQKVKCPYLEYRNGKAYCTIYPNRPQFCREYPATPEDLIPGCGYRFIKVEEERERGDGG